MLANGNQAPNGDLPVVAPINMGNGLLWDDKSQTYYVAVDNRSLGFDELGRLQLRISALEDNQLQIRDDGFYQGYTAPEALAKLYVSNQGNDSNTGEKNSPLKTITAALSKIAAEGKSGSYAILLKAGQTFIENRQFTYLGNGTVNITFTYYDEPNYDERFSDSKGGIWVVADSNLQHPKIIFDTFVDNAGSVRRASFGAGGGR